MLGLYMGLTIMAIIYITIFVILYYSKEHINLFENKLLVNTMILNIIGCILHLLCFWAVNNIESFTIIKTIILKSYVAYIAFFNFLFNAYVLILTHKNYGSRKFNAKEYFNKTTKISGVVHGIIILLIYILPIYPHVGPDGSYTYGPGITLLFYSSGVLLALWLYKTIKSIKNTNDVNNDNNNNNNREIVKYIAIMIGILLIGAVGSITQFVNPSVLMISTMHSIVLTLIYFTIENPDVKMIEQLEIAKEQADKANHAKSDFLSNMSHEIRTPLNAIVGFSESLKDENIPQSARESVDDIIMASNNLLDIVNGILDISKIEANKLEIINKEYDIKSVLDELTALTKARIGDKGLDFRVNIDPALPRVLYGDNIRLKQVILNILTNAVKYTKEGYVIFTVSSVIKDDVCRLIISVEDSGIGIKEESIPKLFSKFERLNVEKEITIEGTGLGLAITKRLVELMNGTIVVQSVYGRGSKFTISIDQRIVAVEPPAVKESPASQSTFVDAKGARILIVDDNELNLKVATVLLNKYHFTIDTATNGIECINKVKEDGNYDIIFLDDMMPRMSGREALAKLKQDPNFKIPVIALTANAITGMRQEYLNDGFNDYLAKPIEKAELERVIKEYISRKRKVSTNTDLSKNTNSILEKQLDVNHEVIPSNNDKTEETSDFSNKKILVVDDNEMNLKIALNSLKKYNFAIDSTNSGSDAISKVIENKYDLILLDEMMPELDGCKTLENFRDIEDFNTPTVMMTASPKDEVQDKLDEYKFDGYLAKPFKKEELDKLINDLLK